MIRSIELNNFQSHKSTLFNFHPGVNSIIGSSDSGKTAVMRGLFWALNNRPSGQAFISHWNQDKKGSPIERTEVTVSLENNIISRGRNPHFNGYVIDGKTLEAIRTDVPEEVAKAFNLGEVNIQKQMDAPFLLSASAGEVARFFNREIRLDLIDRILSAAEFMRRSAKQRIQSSEEQQKATKEKISELDWLDIAESMVNKAEKINNILTTEIANIETLGLSISNYANQQFIIKKKGEALLAIPIVETIEEMNISIKDQRASTLDLSGLIRSYKQAEKTIAELPDIKQAERIVPKIVDKSKELAEYTAAFVGLNNLNQKYAELEYDIKEADEDIKEAEREMPDSCPLCGGII